MILISFGAISETLDVACEIDGLICNSIFSEIDSGALPQALRSLGYKEVNYKLWNTSDKNFDIAVVPTPLVSSQFKDHVVGKLNLKNSYIVIDNGSSVTGGLCSKLMFSDRCMTSKIAFENYQNQITNLVTYSSLYELNKSLLGDHVEVEFLHTFDYSIIIRKGSGLNLEDVESAISVNNQYDWMLLTSFLLLLVAGGGAYIAFVVYQAGKYDEHSSCLSKKTFNFDKSKRLDSFTGFLIDFNNFKLVNDKYGHESGDRLIAEMGRMFTSTLRKEDRVYRIGGDEFIVITRNVLPEEAIIRITSTFNQEAKSIATICGVLDANFGLSIGVRSYTDKSIEDVYSNLDYLMYENKQKQKNLTAYDGNSI